MNESDQVKQLLELTKLLERGMITETEFLLLKSKMIRDTTSVDKGDSCKEINQTTEPFGIVSFSAALMGIVFLPILFVPVGFIAGALSSYRLLENKNLKGKGFMMIGMLLTVLNFLWLQYQYKFGLFY